MGKRMEVLKVATTVYGDVEIIQPDYFGHGDAVISIPVEQVEILVAWLQQAREQILQNSPVPLSRAAGSAE